MTTRAVQYAQGILERYWDRTIPISPEEIIKKIDDLVIEPKELPDNISGKVGYDWGKRKYVITVNENHHENRQRFTIAHELGHYALGHGEKTDTLYRDSALESSPDEVEANAFAAEILMPKAVINHLVFNQNISDVRLLARKLWVSEQSMIYRLKNIGLVI